MATTRPSLWRNILEAHDASVPEQRQQQRKTALWNTLIASDLVDAPESATPITAENVDKVDKKFIASPVAAEAPQKKADEAIAGQQGEEQPIGRHFGGHWRWRSRGFFGPQVVVAPPILPAAVGLTVPAMLPPIPEYYPPDSYYYGTGAVLRPGYMLTSDGWAVRVGTPLRAGVFVRRHYSPYFLGEEVQEGSAKIANETAEYEALAKEREAIEKKMQAMRIKDSIAEQRPAASANPALRIPCNPIDEMLNYEEAAQTKHKPTGAAK